MRVLFLLGLVLAACSLPVQQPGATVTQELATATQAIESGSPGTATVPPTATDPPAPPTSTTAPTDTPVPSPTPTPRPATPTPLVYVVQAGDTLAEIAARFQVSVEAIAAQNGIADVNQIEVGQALTMPDGAVTSQAAKTRAAPAAETPLPTPTIVVDEAAPEAERNWPGICHPSPENEGARVANLPLGETVELTGYLYLKTVTMVSRERIVFSFCPAPYESYPPGSRIDWCTIHAWIPRDTAGSPNHVQEYGTTWTSVVILDMHGREIRGWTGIRDSRYVRMVGTVIRPYGSPTGLDGSNTIEVVEIELLESP